MDYALQDFIPETADEQLFDKYTEYYDSLFIELNTRDPVPPKEYSQSRTRMKIPGEKRIRKIMYDDEGNICAAYSLMVRTKENADYEKNKHIANLFITANENYDFQYLAKILLKDTIKTLQEFESITTIETCCYRERVKEFWESLNAKVAIEGAQNRLYLEDVDWEMIDKWREEGHKRAREERIDLVSFRKCPEDIIEDYSVLYTKIMNLVPMGDFEWKPEDITPKKVRETEGRFEELGYEWHTLITRESTGDLSGITEIFYHKARSHKVEQELTGVTLNFRGRGLGKWLKAEMLFFIKNEFPDVKFVITGNADTNAPMLSINNRMGFKMYLEEKCFTMKISDLPH
ncbi:MAG: hypothetical protein GOP50_07275 [Candidatus Heimdallarchaeota archaeon]|nr:hypothetical protein [Candidatus Heimdallarchaeota archaeon]